MEKAAFPIVLDDLDTSQDSRIYEGTLAKLVNTQRRRNCSLIITTAHELSPRLCQALGFDANDIVRMTPFDRDEIVTFLAERGCAMSHCAMWASMVHMKTLGHPQLVHARVAALEAGGFPHPTANDLIETPRDIQDVRAEARRLLVQLDPGARELIYRLSLTAELFNRERLMAIASIQPPIEEPGNTIDRLIGPWLEVGTSSHFRVSPLVKSTGEEANGRAWASNMHGLIARTFLARRTLTAIDVATILLHALVAQDGRSLTRLSAGLVSTDRAVWRAIAKHASWFAHVHVGPGMIMPAESPGGLFLTRLMQYRIAVYEGLDAVRGVVARFDEEFPQTTTNASARLARFIFLNVMLMHDEVQFAAEEIVDRVTQCVTLSDGLADVLAATPVEEQAALRLVGVNGQRDYAMLAGLSLIICIKNKDDLAAVFDAINSIDSGYARRILWVIGNNEFGAQMVLNRVWLAERGSDAQDWARLRTTIQHVYASARRYDIVGLERAAAKVLVRMTDEALNDPDDALVLADGFAAELGDFPSLLDARARVLSRRGEYQAALALWRNALPEWQSGVDDFAPNYAHRDAALVAARLNYWDEAAQLLAEGARRATSLEQEAFRASLLIDAGFAYWKSGNNAAAGISFAAGIAALDQLQDQAAIEPVRSVQKRAGHTLMWVTASTKGRPATGFSEPPPAYCSSLEAMPEPQPPVTPIDFIIENLIQFEHAAGTRPDSIRRYDDRLRNSPFALIRATYPGVKIRHSLVTLELDGLVAAAVDQVEGLKLAQRHRDEVRDPIEPLPNDARATVEGSDHEMIRAFMLFGIYALAARAISKRCQFNSGDGTHKRGVSKMLSVPC